MMNNSVRNSIICLVLSLAAIIFLDFLKLDKSVSDQIAFEKQFAGLIVQGAVNTPPPIGTAETQQFSERLNVLQRNLDTLEVHADDRKSSCPCLKSFRQKLGDDESPIHYLYNVCVWISVGMFALSVLRLLKLPAEGIGIPVEKFLERIADSAGVGVVPAMFVSVASAGLVAAAVSIPLSVTMHPAPVFQHIELVGGGQPPISPASPSIINSPKEMSLSIAPKIDGVKIANLGNTKPGAQDMTEIYSQLNSSLSQLLQSSENFNTAITKLDGDWGALERISRNNVLATFDLAAYGQNLFDMEKYLVKDTSAIKIDLDHFNNSHAALSEYDGTHRPLISLCNAIAGEVDTNYDLRHCKQEGQCAWQQVLSRDPYHMKQDEIGVEVKQFKQFCSFWVGGYNTAITAVGAPAAAVVPVSSSEAQK